MSDEVPDVVHTTGRFYRCAEGHEFDRVMAKDPNVSPFPPSKTCPTCNGSANVQYVTETHKLYAKCRFGQCPVMPATP